MGKEISIHDCKVMLCALHVLVNVFLPSYSEAMKEVELTSKTIMDNRYDIIGDIHGHADELHALLATLGYKDGAHPEGRQVIFLGDFIDRGPKIREVLETVRGMVDSGDALAILGNHEINAMRFHTMGSGGSPLREHTPNNVQQHRATLDQIPDQEELDDWIGWFAGLPLSLDLGAVRFVHASWADDAIEQLCCEGRLEGETLERYSRKGSAEYDAISLIVNGPEATLPNGFTHETADGRRRSEFRVKWWLDLAGRTCREAIFPEDPDIPDVALRDFPETGYADDAPLTFFGHYAVKDPSPAPIRSNLACLDYGTGKGGFLCAYRWDGEMAIDPTKFVTMENKIGTAVRL